MKQSHKSQGIVLKQTTSHKVAILDAVHGRIDCISFKQPLVGALIRYRIESERRTIGMLADYEIMDLPFFIARSDILFWHHVLELCYYFVPIGSHTPQMFELLQFLYTVDTSSEWGPYAKKLYLCKLFTTLGMQVELPGVSHQILYRFMALQPHQLARESVDTKEKEIVDEWLRVCVSEHPAIEQFKTIHFLLDE